jgi:hypothetical protein
MSNKRQWRPDLRDGLAPQIVFPLLTKRTASENWQPPLCACGRRIDRKIGFRFNLIVSLLFFTMITLEL